MKILGIDLGTTTISGAVIDRETGKNCRSVTIENNTFLPSGNCWEKIQDAEAVMEKAKKLVDRLLEEEGSVCAVGITGQMHGILYTDEKGNSVSPLYTWQDGRGNLPCFEGKSACEQIEEICGEKVSSGYGLVTHYYQVRTGQMPEKARKICTIGDYLAMRLTGRKEPLLHSSSGASLGFYDPQQRAFRKNCLTKCGIDLSILPRITEDVTFCGTYKNLPVCTAIGDNQAGFLGSVENFEHSVLVNVGTGSQVSVYSAKYFTAPGIEVRPFDKDSYLLVGAPLCGGRAYAVLEHFFREYGEAMGITDADHYRIMERLLEKEVRHSSLKVTTTFSGTREDPEKRGKIEQISTENFTPGNLILGVLEGMAQELYDLYRTIEAGTETAPQILVASGNGMRKNKYLREIVSRRFSMDLILSQGQEEAARGAARAALRILEKEEKKKRENGRQKPEENR